MLVFLFAMMIFPSLALDETNGKEHKEDAEFQTFHRRPKPSCICGVTSVKCCRRKRMFSKMGYSELNAYAKNGGQLRE